MYKIIIALILCFSVTYANTQGIVFYHGTFNEVKQEAIKQNKLIFVDCYTSWCGPCKWMAKNVFTDSAVGVFFNTNFINYKLDMEKGDGKFVKKEYNINGYPTLLFINGKGELQHRSLGGCDTSEFIKIAKKALDTENNFGSLLKQYKNGNREPSFLAKYALECVNLNIPYDINEYFKTQPDSELINEINLILIECYIVNVNTREFNYIANNYENFVKKYGKQRIENRIVTIITKTLWIQNFSDKNTVADAINNILSKYNFEDSLKIHYKVLLQYYLTNSQNLWDKYASTAFKYFNDIGISKIENNEVFHIINNISKNLSDTISLKKSIEWCDSLLSKNYSIPEVMLVKAKIYYKLGNNNEALRTANNALSEELKKPKPQTKAYQKFISEIEENKN